VEADVIIVLLVVIGVVVTGALFAAVAVVSAASRTEDRHWTLDGPAPGPAAAAARRIVNFHTEAAEWPRARHGSPVPARSQAPAGSVRRAAPAGEPAGGRFPAGPLTPARPGPRGSYRTS
jgi:hypothetical protein